MNSKLFKGLWFALLAFCLMSAPVRAGEASEADEQAEDEEEGSSHAFNIDVGWASAYVFRGANVFGGGDQQQQNGLFAPGVSWNIFGSGLTLGYWGAFQTNGDNVSANIDAGLGAEQDLYLTYEWSLADVVTLFGGLYYYFYPWAEEAAAGHDAPMYLEPIMGATLSMLLDFSLNVSYLSGLQDAVRPGSYVYINPRISRDYSLLPIFNLFWGAGYGYKIWHHDHSGDTNTHDVQLDLGATVDLFDTIYVTPAIHLTWTNIEGADNGFTDGLLFWGGINAGVNL